MRDSRQAVEKSDYSWVRFAQSDACPVTQGDAEALGSPTSYGSRPRDAR